MKQIFFLLLGCWLCAATLHAQPFQTTAGLPNTNEIYWAGVGNTTGYLTVGTTNAAPSGNDFTLVSQFDPNGNLSWSRYVGITSPSVDAADFEARDVCQAPELPTDPSFTPETYYVTGVTKAHRAAAGN